MNKLLPIVLGLAIIGYLAYVLFLVMGVFFDWNDDTWQSINTHLIVVGVLAILMLFGYFFGDTDKKEKTNTKKLSNKDPVDPDITEKRNVFNPITDQLHFGVYKQEFTSWWYDNDGDRHEPDTISALLRFYSDGTVISIRETGIPKIEYPSSFTRKGQFEFNNGKLSFSLEKVNDIDDSCTFQVTDSDRKQMNYYGEIADDFSLIKEGNYQGIVQDDLILINDYSFYKLPVSEFIITASDDTCEELELRLRKNSYVISTFQDTGNWYTNGETGPEWFTIHIKTWQNWKEPIEKLVQTELADMQESSFNQFWG